MPKTHKRRALARAQIARHARALRAMQVDREAVREMIAHAKQSWEGWMAYGAMQNFAEQLLDPG